MSEPEDEPAVTPPNAPRIVPVERSEATDRQAELLDGLGPASGLNIFRTLAHHPRLLRSWLPFGGRLLQGSSLPERDRELVILRVAARCRSDYEWGQHVAIGRIAGLADEEVLRVASFTGDEGWPAWEALLLRATDELVIDHCIEEPTWTALADTYDTSQLIELTMLAGHYAMLAGTLRSAGTRTEMKLPSIGEV